jgi:hypothetical protein
LDRRPKRKESQTHTKRELERRCHRIASHRTWADGEGGRRRKGGASPLSCNSPCPSCIGTRLLLALDDCVINVPSPSLQMEPARFFIFSYSNGAFLVSAGRADDADAFLPLRVLCCRCMLVGHLNPPHGPLSSSLTMIDVSSFLSPRPSFSFFFLTCPAGSLPAPPPLLYIVLLCAFVPLSCCPFRDPTFPVFPSFLFMMIQAEPIDRWLLPRIYLDRETHTERKKNPDEILGIFFFFKSFLRLYSPFSLCFFIKR